MRVAVCIVLAALLAGCLVPSNTDQAGSGDADTDEPSMQEPYWLTLYLHANGTMTAELPDAQRVTIDWGYQQWLDGTPAPLWLGDLPGPVVVLEGNLTLFYEATKPTTGGDARPELTAWWGSEHSHIDHIFMDGPQTVGAGTIVKVTSPLHLPGGGFTYGHGEDTALRIGSYYLDGPLVSAMDVLVGGDTPSRLDMLVQPVARHLYEATEILATSGTVMGSRCAVAINPAEMADAYHEVQVGPDAVGLGVTLTGYGRPTVDMDLVVYGPNGTVVGGGHSSFDQEGAHLWQNNLAVDGPGTYTLRVVSCTPQTGTYTLAAWSYAIVA